MAGTARKTGRASSQQWRREFPSDLSGVFEQSFGSSRHPRAILMMEDSTKAEIGEKRDGDVRWTHQQRQMEAVNEIPQSQGPSIFQGQKWCDSSLDCSSSSVCMQLMMTMIEQNMKLQQQLADQQQQFAAQQQEYFFRWCSSIGELIGGSKTLPAEPAKCDNLVPEEGEGKLWYECERLLGTQYGNETIDPCFPKVDAAQLGKDSSCLGPFKIQRGRHVEGNMVSQQVKRSQVELNKETRGPLDKAHIVTMVTEEFGSNTSLRNVSRGQKDSREEEHGALDVTVCLSSHHQCIVGCCPAVGWKSAEQFGSKEVVVVGKDPVMWLEWDRPKLVVHHHKRAIRKAKMKKLFCSHRPRLRPRTRWKLGAQLHRSVNYRRPG